MLVVTDSRCTEYATLGHPERPARINRTVEKLRQQRDVPIIWGTPSEVDERTLRLAHQPEHIDRVKQPGHDFDSDTPAYPGIYDHACRSVGAALRAVRAAREGEVALSLIRPPGHHATKTRAMGFCYFNSIAIALLEAVRQGMERVAVFDFDVHHGNGTEDILRDHPRALFVSVHQYPCYPGTGRSHVGTNCRNYPVAPMTPRAQYREVLERAFAEVQKFKPLLLGVSAGFDAYVDDPIAQETLEAEDFAWLGQMVRAFKVPAFHVLEGGYSNDLPSLVLAYLRGLTGR